MSNDYRDALLALHDALTEIKKTVKDSEKKISEINVVLERQGLKNWNAGETVSKEYCRYSHDSLVCDVNNKVDFLEAKITNVFEELKLAISKEYTELDKKLNSRIKWAWVIFSFVLGIYGTLIAIVLQKLF